MASLSSASSVFGGEFIKSVQSSERVFFVNRLLRNTPSVMQTANCKRQAQFDALGFSA
jgi:hypothetical protein